MSKTSRTSPRRRRPSFRIVRLHLRYPVFRQKAEYVLAGLRSAFETMRERGYILGEEMAFWIDGDWGHVNAIAAFIGEHACEAALEDESVKKMLCDSHEKPAGRISFAQAMASAKEFEIGKLEFARLAGNSPLPCCNCPRGSTGPLDLWCTPWSKAPPLLCSEGGVVEYWRLGLSELMYYQLNEWRESVEPLVLLAVNSVTRDLPSGKQAARLLRDKRSWVSKASIALAKDVSKEIGRPVRAFCPPYHVFRL